MSGGDRGSRRIGVALVATAEDQEMATEWQQALTAQGIMSVLHGHREDEGHEDAEFTGIDVLVPASALKQARQVLGSSVVAPESDEKPFPWLLLALGPVLFFAIMALILVLVLA